MQSRKRYTCFVAAGLIAASLFGSSGLKADDQADDAALVSRGEYLARAGDCMPCHTGDASKPFAGGLGLNTPFGTLFSVNITSDPDTGIGKWTYEDFKNALHDGIRADGAYLYPAMPFDAYTLIEEEDLKALWAFVRRIPAVHAPNPENQLSFPFNVRLGMAAWRELFFAPAYFQPTPGKSDQWNRGAYLVEALGHCTDCHSPRNFMGAVEGKDQFVGAEVDGFYAPDIASAALAKTWTQDTLVQFLKTGTAPGKTEVFGPMAEVVHDSLSHLTDDDLAAMATYLLDSPPPADAPAPQRLSPLSAEVHKRAAKLYVDNCMTCHQAHGTGIAGSVPPLAGNPAVTPAEPYNIITVVLEGLPADGNFGAMPSFAGRLSDQDVADLANYLRTSWGNQAAPNASAGMVATWRSTVQVPDYGTQAAVGFDCPTVGGAPGAAGPDAQAVASLSAMMQGGNRDLPELVQAYESAASDSDLSDVVEAMAAAYCPIVAASDRSDEAKYAELRRFTQQVAAIVSPQAAAADFPPVDTVWAARVGRSLVAREPSSFSGTLTCPANDGKLVPQDLVTKAAGLIGQPKLPVNAAAADQFATTLAQQNPKAALADVANALIAAYCPLVAAETSSDPAEQHAWLESFGQQVIQTLQAQKVASKD